MNKKTLALTDEQYETIITVLKEGYENHEPNERIAVILVLEANLGLRISDILTLRKSSFVKDGNRYRLDIKEEKTGKVRTFTVPDVIYNYVMKYAKGDAKIFEISERRVQKALQDVCKYLDYEGVSTHSFRKYFATSIYINNDYNIQLVSKLLQHSSVAITQRYIGIQQKDVENALQKHIKLI